MRLQSVLLISTCALMLPPAAQPAGKPEDEVASVIKTILGKNFVLDWNGIEKKVRLARCGPVYTESTNNWYAITSPKTQPAMLQQSIRYEGNQVQDAYAVRFDGTLPARDPRDREPGVGGCR